MQDGCTLGAEGRREMMPLRHGAAGTPSMESRFENGLRRQVREKLEELFV